MPTQLTAAITFRCSKPCRFLALEHLANGRLAVLRPARGNLNFAAAADIAFDAGPRIEVDDTEFGENPNEDFWMCIVPINDYQCVHFHIGGITKRR